MYHCFTRITDGGKKGAVASAWGKKHKTTFVLSLHKIPRALVGRRGSRGAAPPGIWMNMDIMVGAPWSCKIIQASWSCKIIQVPFDPFHKQMEHMRYPCSSSWAKLGETSWCHPQQKDLSPLAYAALGLLQVLPGKRQDQMSM